MTTLIVMPTYGLSHYLGAAIDSIIAQTCRDWLLVVVDDGSPDPQTWPGIEMRMATDERVSGLRLTENRGIAAARNAGYEHGKALFGGRPKFVWFHDHDDLSLPGALDALAGSLAGREDVLGVMGQTYRINAAGEPFLFMPDGLPEREFGWNGTAPGETFGFEDLYSLRPQYRTMGQFLFRGETYEASGGFKPDFAPADDMEFLMCLSKSGGRFLALPDFTIAYRDHGGQTTKKAFPPDVLARLGDAARAYHEAMKAGRD